MDSDEAYLCLLYRLRDYGLAECWRRALLRRATLERLEREGRR